MPLAGGAAAPPGIARPSRGGRAPPARGELIGVGLRNGGGAGVDIVTRAKGCCGIGLQRVPM